MKVTASAPGKLMLFGEHAVVYGYPCLVTAVDQRLVVIIEETNNGKIVVDAPEVKDTRFVDVAIAEAIKTWNIHHNGFRLTTKSDFSGKYGLGSSSAVTVATLKALASFYHMNVDSRVLFDVAYRVVVSVQGAGSGFDVASAIWGGTLYYEKMKLTIEPLQSTGMPLIVGYTGVKADTTSLIAEVAKKRQSEPQKVDRIFDAIAKLVEEAKEKMIEGDWERVGRLMDFNQEYLRDLGVSSEKLESLISAAKKAGAWGAKLSGAGGGDCMIALAPSDKKEAISMAIENAGGEVIDVKASAEGVRCELHT